MNIETANILLQYRKKSGLSQEELASKIGVSRQAVSKWERAEASPDTDNLILLAKVYGVTLDELLTGDPEEILNRNKQDLEDNKTEENTQTDTGKETENIYFLFLYSLYCCVIQWNNQEPQPAGYPTT